MMDADLTALSSVDDFIWQYNVFGPVERNVNSTVSPLHSDHTVSEKSLFSLIR